MPSVVGKQGTTRWCAAARGIIGVVIVVFATSTLAETPVPQSACWDPASLVARQGEEIILKGVTEAYQLPPTRAPATYSAIQEHGVIRRVELMGSKKLIALTFDLCEQPYEVSGYQGEIVDFLRKNKVKATFFLGGKWMLTHRTRAQQLMTDRSFEVANHTWEHRNLRLLSGSQLAEEVERAQLAYEEVRRQLEVKHPAQCVVPGGGTLAERKVPPRLGLFRFPFGACNAKALEAVAELGLRAIQWDVSSGDPAKGASAEELTRNVLQHVRPGSIVLFHANGRGWHTSAALPAIIANLRAQGYEFVTVSELLMQGTPVVTATCYDSKPGDTEHYDDLSRRLEVQYQQFKSRFTAALAKPGNGDVFGGSANPQDSGEPETFPSKGAPPPVSAARPEKPRSHLTGATPLPPTRPQLFNDNIR